MNALTSFYVVPILWNCILVSSSILTPLKTEDSLRIFKETPNDFEYVLKRHGINGRSDDSDSKERRSTMGSSFIRFGRSQSDGNMESTGLGGDLDGDTKVNRYPRWKSPDIVIRFGRSGFKGVNGEQVHKRGRNDLNFIRFGRNVEVIPLDVDMDPMMLNLELAKICSSLLSNDGTISREFHPQTTRLMRLCNLLNNSDDDYSNTLRFLDEQADSKHQ